MVAVLHCWLATVRTTLWCEKDLLTDVFVSPGRCYGGGLGSFGGVGERSSGQWVREYQDEDADQPVGPVSMRSGNKEIHWETAS